MGLALKLGLVAVVAVAAFGAIQVIRFEPTNPPVTADLEAPPDVKDVLRRSCYDCHSNETTWPWYARVAPTSWLVHYDVAKGREALNFSDWERLPPDERVEKRRETVESVLEGTMPPPSYLLTHPAARVPHAERVRLQAWAASRRDEP